MLPGKTFKPKKNDNYEGMEYIEAHGHHKSRVISPPDRKEGTRWVLIKDKKNEIIAVYRLMDINFSEKERCGIFRGLDPDDFEKIKPQLVLEKKIMEIQRSSVNGIPNMSALNFIYLHVLYLCLKEKSALVTALEYEAHVNGLTKIGLEPINRVTTHYPGSHRYGTHQDPTLFFIATLNPGIFGNIKHMATRATHNNNWIKDELPTELRLKPPTGKRCYSTCTNIGLFNDKTNRQPSHSFSSSTSFLLGCSF